MSYVILLARLERAALAERQIVALLSGEIPEDNMVSAAADRFDAALAAPPEPESENDRIRRELGF